MPAVKSAREFDVRQLIGSPNFSTGQRAQGVVVWKGAARNDGWELGVELVASDLTFWGIEFLMSSTTIKSAAIVPKRLANQPEAASIIREVLRPKRSPGAKPPAQPAGPAACSRQNSCPN